jgi:hypothetical protein
VVEKKVVPKERVRLEKDAVTDEDPVSKEVRKEQIEAEGDRPPRWLAATPMGRGVPPLLPAPGARPNRSSVNGDVRVSAARSDVGVRAARDRFGGIDVRATLVGMLAALAFLCCSPA